MFDGDDALDQLEALVSLNGPDCYGLPANEDRITLVRHNAPVGFAPSLATKDGPLTVFDPEIALFWNYEPA